MNRVVLDTNVVLDLLHFDDPVARPVRQALEAGRVRCVVSDATLDEWRRVLAYPEFGLDAARQAALLERYRALCERVVVEARADPPGRDGTTHDGRSCPSGRKPMGRSLPRCSDPDDQKFLELAAASGAQALVSKDRALLRLRRRCAPWYRVLTPAEAAHAFSPPPAAGT